MFDRLRLLFNRKEGGVPDGIEVRFCEYRREVDLTGKYLIPRLIDDPSRSAVEEWFGPLKPSTQMRTLKVGAQRAVDMNGQRADEIHAFLSVTSGASSYQLDLGFRDGRLIFWTRYPG
jgi:hypothetical protein